jgi:PTS system nitrogen regulatory IIA component
MYLNLVQIAESFGVSENVIEGWIRSEGLPHVPERGRLLFDRAQVANWAAARGLAAHAGFLAPVDHALNAQLRLEPLLRRGGIWRNLGANDVTPTLLRVVNTLTGAAPSVRQLVAQRLRASGGVTIAPVGGGFALPHPSARIAVGRESGTLSLLMLREPLPLPEPPPDEVPITTMFFFIAPSPRAHLDMLGRLSRLLSRGQLRELIAQGANDDAIFAAIAAADAATGPTRQEEAR